MTTKNQDSLWPTRKMWATLISGAAVLAVQISVYRLAPGLPTEEYTVEVGATVQMLVMALAGYFAKEWAPK